MNTTSKYQISEIRIGISSCLLGVRVRYDGGHKLHRYIKETLGKFVRFVPGCPEMDIGLGVPRETIQLESRGNETRLIATDSRRDLTNRMTRYSLRKGSEIARAGLSGYILKKNSPSCGTERVKIHRASGRPSRNGVGIFAAGLKATNPLLPIEEEGRLEDPKIRENFLERVFAYTRLQRCFSARWTLRDLMAFHAAEEYLLLAHDPGVYRALERIVARAEKLERRKLAESYRRRFMAGLERRATPSKHIRVLRRMSGHFNGEISADEKAEIDQAIREYKQQLVPLIVPLTLVRHFVRRYKVESLFGQTYLQPHPSELMLRNRV